MVCDKDICRFDVAMHNSFGMCGVESVSDLNVQTQNGFDLQGLSRNQEFEGLPLKQLHWDEGPVIDLVNLVNCADIGMVQRRGRARLAVKTAERLRVFGEFFGKKLQGNMSAELQVFSFVNHAHAATADLA